jgi:hypothetical protein
LASSEQAKRPCFRRQVCNAAARNRKLDNRYLADRTKTPKRRPSTQMGATSYRRLVRNATFRMPAGPLVLNIPMGPDSKTKRCIFGADREPIGVSGVPKWLAEKHPQPAPANCEVELAMLMLS